MPTRRINGQPYHYEIAGDGPPLCLLHGFTGSTRNWAALLPALAMNFRVVLVDLLGHGRSAVPAEVQRYRMERAAADLHDLLATITEEPVHLLGYSMGGRLALYHAHHHPGQVRSLILESSSPGLATAAERRERRERDEALAEWIIAKGITRFVDRWESLPLWASQERMPDAARAALRRRRLQNDPRGLANSLRGMGTGAQPSLWPTLPQLQPPVMLIAGELDAKFAAINQKMAALLPDAGLEIITQAGHMVHWERPSLFTELIISFVAGLTRE